MQHYISIRVKGHLDPSWSVWFDHFQINYDSYGETILSGIVTGCEEWIGLLENVHATNLQLVSVFPRETWFSC